jgi:hypothetical protein
MIQLRCLQAAYSASISWRLFAPPSQINADAGSSLCCGKVSYGLAKNAKAAAPGYVDCENAGNYEKERWII